MTEDLNRLMPIVEVIGRRPGMYVGRSDDVFAVNTFLSGLFMGASLDLSGTFREWVRSRYADEPRASFAQLEWSLRNECPEISDDVIIYKIAQIAQDFLSQRIKSGDIS
ncbi:MULTISPECIES: hypothetical protein [unclassified Ruegeria]|uniref:hypothetical protein n=1 Tax=unclassified Ruegeria TaxID=2625375 RepID=UPI001488B2E1|nr:MULTISPECIES: hypothetical protein [unclassified Ruegeria]